MKPDIKFFVCCHKKEQIAPHELLAPVQVGAVLAGERFEGFLQDDTGEHISDKNRSYCELTAQYWAWKNVHADYYGFFHYRRFLYPKIGAKQPYRIEKCPEEKLLDRLGYDGFAAFAADYDVIAPIGEDMHVSVREHYAGAQYHHGKDLALIGEILRERHPEMTEALESYLSGTVNYFGNIYIMKQQVFFDYCSWLFPILEEFDRRADLTGYCPQELRVNGYLAERMFGVWLTYMRRSLRVCEVPRVHFIADTGERMKKKLLNFLLPPGSKRRSLIKSVMKG